MECSASSVADMTQLQKKVAEHPLLDVSPARTSQHCEGSLPAAAPLVSCSAGSASTVGSQQLQAELAALVPVPQDSVSSSQSPVPNIASSGQTGASDGSSSGVLLPAHAPNDGAPIAEKRAREAEQLPQVLGAAHAFAPIDDDVLDHPAKSPRAGRGSAAEHFDPLRSCIDAMPVDDLNAPSVPARVADASALEPFSFGPLPTGSVSQLAQLFEPSPGEVASEAKSSRVIDRALLDISAASSTMPVVPPLQLPPGASGESAYGPVARTRTSQKRWDAVNSLTSVSHEQCMSQPHPVQSSCAHESLPEAGATTPPLLSHRGAMDCGDQTEQQMTERMEDCDLSGELADMVDDDLPSHRALAQRVAEYNSKILEVQQLVHGTPSAPPATQKPNVHAEVLGEPARPSGSAGSAGTAMASAAAAASDQSVNVAIELRRKLDESLVMQQAFELRALEAESSLEDATSERDALLVQVASLRTQLEESQIEVKSVTDAVDMLVVECQKRIHQNEAEFEERRKRSDIEFDRLRKHTGDVVNKCRILEGHNHSLEKTLCDAGEKLRSQAAQIQDLESKLASSQQEVQSWKSGFARSCSASVPLSSVQPAPAPVQHRVGRQISQPSVPDAASAGLSCSQRTQNVFAKAVSRLPPATQCVREHRLDESELDMRPPCRSSQAQHPAHVSSSGVHPSAQDRSAYQRSSPQMRSEYSSHCSYPQSVDSSQQHPGAYADRSDQFVGAQRSVQQSNYQVPQQPGSYSTTPPESNALNSRAVLVGDSACAPGSAGSAGTANRRTVSYQQFKHNHMGELDKCVIPPLPSCANRNQWLQDVESAVVSTANHPDHTVVLRWVKECRTYRDDPHLHFPINGPNNPFPQLDVKLRTGLAEQVDKCKHLALRRAVGRIATAAHENDDMVSGRAILCIILHHLQVNDDQSVVRSMEFLSACKFVSDDHEKLTNWWYDTEAAARTAQSNGFPNDPIYAHIRTELGKSKALAPMLAAYDQQHRNSKDWVLLMDLVIERIDYIRNTINGEQWRRDVLAPTKPPKAPKAAAAGPQQQKPPQKDKRSASPASPTSSSCSAASFEQDPKEVLVKFKGLCFDYILNGRCRKPGCNYQHVSRDPDDVLLLSAALDKQRGKQPPRQRRDDTPPASPSSSVSSKRPPLVQGVHGMLCGYFARDGKCRFAGQCRFLHADTQAERARADRASAGRGGASRAPPSAAPSPPTQTLLPIASSGAARGGRRSCNQFGFALVAKRQPPIGQKKAGPIGAGPAGTNGGNALSSAAAAQRS